MISTAKRIIKGVWNKAKRKRPKSNFVQLKWLQKKIVKHQDDKRIKKITLNDITIFYQRPYELLHTYKELFENEIYRFVTSSSTPLIIDCGSNIGISVLYYKQLFPKCIVHAFEPDEKNFSILQQNVQVNNLKGVHIYTAAVWTHDGCVNFDADGSEASHINEKAKAIGQVSSVRLQSILASFKEIDFLKIDIEGAEWDVLRDCASDLKHVNNLFFEYHGKSFHTGKLNDLLQIVDAAGFHVYIRNAADALAYPFVQKQTATPYDVQLNIFCYRD